MSGSRAGLDPPRCNSIERSFPFRSCVADPVIYITTVSGSFCPPRELPLKEISGGAIDNQSAAAAAMKERSAGLLTMEVDQNPLAKNPNKGEARWDPISRVGWGYATETCEPLRCRLQNKEISGKTDLETGELGKYRPGCHYPGIHIVTGSAR